MALVTGTDRVAGRVWRVVRNDAEVLRVLEVCGCLAAYGPSYDASSRRLAPSCIQAVSRRAPRPVPRRAPHSTSTAAAAMRYCRSDYSRQPVDAAPACCTLSTWQVLLATCA